MRLWGTTVEVPDWRKERAPILRVFGPLAGRVAGLVRACPSLVTRLVVAPRPAIHAMGAYLHLAPEAAGPDHDVGLRIEDTDPRDLLLAALPDAPPRLYRALDRAGDHVRGRDFYSRLGAAVTSPLGPSLLDGGLLNDQRLDHVDAVLAADPLVAMLSQHFPSSICTIDHLDSLVTLLRTHGAVDAVDWGLAPNAGPRGAFRRMQQALDALTAPDPGFEPPAPFRVVPSLGDLRRIGISFENCVGHAAHYAARHWFRLTDGSMVFLIADNPPVLLALRPLIPGALLVIEEVASPKNAPVSPEVVEKLRSDLLASGVKALRLDPADAIWHLHSLAARKSKRAEDDVETDLEWLAA
jgi:hypothetical protein